MERKCLPAQIFTKEKVLNSPSMLAPTSLIQYLRDIDTQLRMIHTFQWDQY